MTSLSIYLELFIKVKPWLCLLGVKVSEKLEISTGKHKLVDYVEAYKTVIGKKSDFAHDSKKPARFAGRLKNPIKEQQAHGPCRLN